MAATLEEFRNKVLRKLKVLAQGQAASSEDAKVVEDAYQELYELLTLEKTINYPDVNSIPDESVTPMVYVVAAHLFDDFQVPTQEQMSIQGQVPEMERRLRKQVVPIYNSSAPIKSTYY